MNGRIACWIGFLFLGAWTCHGETATLTGSVWNAQVQPMANALVSLHTTPTSQTAVALTDGLGHYELRDIPAGIYRARIVLQLQSCTALWYSNRTSFGAADAITLGANQTQTVNLVVQGNGWMSGIVRDQNDRNLAGLFVNVYDTDFNFIAGARTATNGGYKIEGLPAGDYFMLFADPVRQHPYQWYDGVTNFQDAAKLTVPVGGGVSNFVAKLKTLPYMGAIRTAQGLSISWPLSKPDYQLQTAVGLWPASLWNNVTNRPYEEDDQWRVFLPMTQTQQFFRLLY